MSSPTPVSGLFGGDDAQESPAGPGTAGPDPADGRSSSSPGRAAVVIAWAGYIVYGIPALLVVPALVTTAARFGVGPTMTDALPAALTVLTPLLAWLVYTARRRQGVALGWLLATVVASTLLVITPLFFWAGPALTVVGMEAVRVIAFRRRSVPATSSRRKS